MIHIASNCCLRDNLKAVVVRCDWRVGEDDDDDDDDEVAGKAAATVLDEFEWSRDISKMMLLQKASNKQEENNVYLVFT